VIVELRSPAVLFTSLRGHPDASMGGELAAALDEHLESPYLRQLLFEAEQLVGYDSSVRIEGTRVLLKHRERIVHVLVRSKLVQMGLAVMNVAFQGEIRGYKERGAFLRALNAALANR
jgi:hypothetical protein